MYIHVENEWDGFLLKGNSPKPPFQQSVLHVKLIPMKKQLFQHLKKNTRHEGISMAFFALALPMLSQAPEATSLVKEWSPKAIEPVEVLSHEATVSYQIAKGTALPISTSLVFRAPLLPSRMDSRTSESLSSRDRKRKPLAADASAQSPELVRILSIPQLQQAAVVPEEETILATVPLDITGDSYRIDFGNEPKLPTRTSEGEEISSVVFTIRASRKCPDPSKLLGLCNSVGRVEDDGVPNSGYSYLYERKINEAACVDYDTDSDEEIVRKVNEIWVKYIEKMKCNSTGFNVVQGNILKYAVNYRFNSFIEDAAQVWRVPLNTVDESDGRTVLDYVEDELKKYKGMALESNLKAYYKILRRGGAKHVREL